MMLWMLAVLASRDCFPARNFKSIHTWEWTVTQRKQPFGDQHYCNTYKNNGLFLSPAKNNQPSEPIPGQRAGKTNGSFVKLCQFVPSEIGFTLNLVNQLQHDFNNKSHLFLKDHLIIDVMQNRHPSPSPTANSQNTNKSDGDLD